MVGYTCLWLGSATKLTDDGLAGYPEFVKFMSTANNFSIFRSFDRLNNRMILHLQEELRVIEKDWDDLDRNAVRQGVSRGSLQVDEVNDALSDDEQEPNGESGANRKQCLVKRTIDKVMLYSTPALISHQGVR